MMAAVLFLVPGVVVGAVRLLTVDDSINVAGLGFAIVVAVGFTAIFSHVGAGLVRRRKPGSG